MSETSDETSNAYFVRSAKAIPILLEHAPEYRLLIEFRNSSTNGLLNRLPGLAEQISRVDDILGSTLLKLLTDWTPDKSRAGSQIDSRQLNHILDIVDRKIKEIEEASLEGDMDNAIRFEESSRHRSPDKNLIITIDIENDSPTDAVAQEIANLVHNLNALHVAYGGEGLEVDDWETLIRVRPTVVV